MNLHRLAFCLAFLLAGAASSAAQTVKLEFLDGRVNLVAQDAPLRTILAEWARLGGTRILNGEGVTGPPVTLELTAYPERQALEILLRGVPGYMLTARDAAGTGASYYDRVMILATTSAPRPAAGVATFAQQAPPAVTFFGSADDAPTERPDGATPPRPVPIGMTAPTGALTVQPGAASLPFQTDPDAATRPPAPPPPPPGPANPFTTLPGSSRPGEITPVPQQDARPGSSPNAPVR